jgi:hypothetical protein
VALRHVRPRRLRAGGDAELERQLRVACFTAALHVAPGNNGDDDDDAPPSHCASLVQEVHPPCLPPPLTRGPFEPTPSFLG